MTEFILNVKRVQIYGFARIKCVLKAGCSKLVNSGCYTTLLNNQT